MSTVMMIGRLLLSLSIVLGAMWLLGRWARKRSGRGARGGQVLSVLARQQVSRNSTVAIVKVVDRAIIVGVTDGQVTLLGDTDLEQVEALTASPSSSLRQPRQAGQPRPARSVGPDRPANPRRVRAPRPLAVNGAQATMPAGPLSGSALSLATWRQALDAVRERTVRRQ
jgi:flagellar protein FliO/FliZ